jgi:hypothetical protein
LIPRRKALAYLGAGIALVVSVASTGGRPLARPGDATWSGINSQFRWQPFELAKGDTMIVPAGIGGANVDAMLDSGSAFSVISSSLATKLGLVGVAEGTIRGSSGRATARRADDVVVTFDGDQWKLATARIVDLAAASRAFGRDIDLVFGLDILDERSLAIDFVANRLAFGPTGAFEGGEHWKPLPLSRGANLELIVLGSIAGLESAPLILDIGSSSGIMLARSYVDEHRLLDGQRWSTAAMGGVDGIRTETVFTLPTAALAGSTVTDIPSMVIDGWLSSSAIGNIGLPLLAQFDIVLDVGAKTLWVHVPQFNRRSLMLKERSGLGVAASPNGLTVAHVASGSPAAAGGWTTGERIVAINGQRVDASYTRGSLWRWRFQPAGHVVSLTLADGHERKITLDDYY